MLMKPEVSAGCHQTLSLVGGIETNMRIDVRGVVPRWRILRVRSVLQVFVQELETVKFERQRQCSLLFSRFEADQRKICELQWLGTAPLMSTWRHARESFPQASVFAYLKPIKNWRQEWPGNKASTERWELQATWSQAVAWERDWLEKFLSSLR